MPSTRVRVTVKKLFEDSSSMRTSTIRIMTTFCITTLFFRVRYNSWLNPYYRGDRRPLFR